MLNDELKVFRGKDYKIADGITIHMPTLGEICDYGEQDYWNMVSQITAVPINFCWQLWDAHIDYSTITAWQLYYTFLYNQFSVEKTSIIFGDLDFTKFIPILEDKNIVLVQYIKRTRTIRTKDNRTRLQKLKDKLCRKKIILTKEESYPVEVKIDEQTYEKIMDYIRKSNKISKDERIAGNESTKKAYIEDARDDYEYYKFMHKESHSQLLNLISAMVNSEGFKYNYEQVWDMKINTFMDSVQRISKIKNANLLLQSGYSGYGINLKDIDKKQLDWLGEL